MLDGIETNVLREYAKYISHIRSEIRDQRFGLVFGAGISKPLGFPNWKELVHRISIHPEVQGQHVASASNDVSETAQTQFLFQHFRTLCLDQGADTVSARFEREVQGRWRRIIHSCLYQAVPTSASELLNSHPYIGDLIDVVLETELTINYNFDDTIQRILLSRPIPDGSNRLRNFDTIWNASLPRKQNSATILHPNGFLPKNLLEFPSDHLVFSEDSFADQLIESMAGHHASLLHHYARSTCLFIGLSMQDGTLRHLLRQSATINPGNCHYIINWRPSDKERDKAVEQTIRDSNFEVYNLVTLFLNDEEIAALGRLISMDETTLIRSAEEIGVPLKYFYYVTGAIGTGKTTCVSNLTSFKAHDEWTEARPEELGLSWKELNEEEKHKVDEWIVNQFGKKNCNLLEQKIGIHVIDRTPLDPISFTPENELCEKAIKLRSGISPGSSKRKIQDGHVLLLTGEADSLESRIVGRHKKSRADDIRQMQIRLKDIFSENSVSEISTEGRSIREVVKQVSRNILLDEYLETDLDRVLTEIIKI